jgi:RecA/RadA recombinase
MTKDPFVSALNKALGGSVKVTLAEDYDPHWEDKISTGLTSLDMHIGGGYSRGTVAQVHGPPGSGKDLLINLAMAQCQLKFGKDTKIAWLSFGYPPDIPYMQMCGVRVGEGTKLGKLYFIDLARTRDAESAPSEMLFTAAIKAVEDGGFQLVVINELGSGETKDNVVKELYETVKVGTWSKLVSDFGKRFYTVIRMPLEDNTRNRTLVLVANPVRANVVTGYGSKNAPLTTDTSGWALRHLKCLDIHLRSGRSVVKGKVKEGKFINWKVKKAKHGVSEGAEGQIYFKFNEGVDIVDDLVNTAIAMSIIRRRGNKYDVPDAKGSAIEVAGGKDGVISFFKERTTSESLMPYIKAQILKSIRNHGQET